LEINYHTKLELLNLKFLLFIKRYLKLRVQTIEFSFVAVQRSHMWKVQTILE